MYMCTRIWSLLPYQRLGRKMWLQIKLPLCKIFALSRAYWHLSFFLVCLQIKLPLYSYKSSLFPHSEWIRLVWLRIKLLYSMRIFSIQLCHFSGQKSEIWQTSGLQWGKITTNIQRNGGRKTTGARFLCSLRYGSFLALTVSSGISDCIDHTKSVASSKFFPQQEQQQQQTFTWCVFNMPRKPCQPLCACVPAAKKRKQVCCMLSIDWTSSRRPRVDECVLALCIFLCLHIALSSFLNLFLPFPLWSLFPLPRLVRALLQVDRSSRACWRCPNSGELCTRWWTSPVQQLLDIRRLGLLSVLLLWTVLWLLGSTQNSAVGMNCCNTKGSGKHMA